MMQLDILKNETPRSIESKLAEVESARGEVHIRLARNRRKAFFLESSLFGLLATASDGKRSLVLKDWHSKWESREIRQYLASSPSTLAAFLNAAKVVNERDMVCTMATREIVQWVAVRRGKLEQAVPQNGKLIGKSLTVCAIDPDLSEPTVLAGLLRKKKSFMNEFVDLKRTHFGSHDSDPELAGFIFELYQNGFEHGRVVENSIRRRTLRYIAIRRQLRPNREVFLKHSGGVPRLREYMGKYYDRIKRMDIRYRRQPAFLEISISDQGCGIVDHFIAHHREFSDRQSPEGQHALINELVQGGYSSKVHTRGAGFGLNRAIEAIQYAGGFLSLRTNGLWVCGGFHEGRSARDGLSSVFDTDKLRPVVGTHYNILIPVTR